MGGNTAIPISQKETEMQRGEVSCPRSFCWGGGHTRPCCGIGLAPEPELFLPGAGLALGLSSLRGSLCC